MKIAANSAAPEEERNFELIPEGKYLCKVLDVTVKHSNKVGDYWNLKLEIDDGGKYDGKFIWDNLFFTPKGLNRFFLAFKRLTGMELDRKADLDVDHADLFGCKAYVTVEHVEEEYKGKMQTKVKVPWDGYASLDGIAEIKAKREASESEDVPF